MKQSIILLDFAENYSFVTQDAVQCFHWENSQATLHLLFVYHRSPNNILESLNICVLSDHGSNNLSAVPAFLPSALFFVKTKTPFVQKVVCCSDGAASQYKNYKAFMNLYFNQ